MMPRQWKMIQTVQEKFTCRARDSFTQPPDPIHAIDRDRPGSNLLAVVLDSKIAQHQPPNRQSEVYARENVDLDVLMLAD